MVSCLERRENGCNFKWYGNNDLQYDRGEIYSSLYLCRYLKRKGRYLEIFIRAVLKFKLNLRNKLLY